MKIKKLFFSFLYFFFMFAVFSQNCDFKKIGSFSCGKQPKQVLFSPDSRFVIIPLLEDDGFDIFSLEEKKVVQRINPPRSGQKGFAEGLFIPEKKAFLVSQMTTGFRYEYSYPDFIFRREIETKGSWSKFIAYSEKNNLIAVSSWLSNDVSLIDYKTGSLVRLLKTKKAPRGLCFTKNEQEIISLSFEGSSIQKFDVSRGILVDEINIEKSAMRHIVCDKDGKFAYISDMYHRVVYKLDLNSFKIVKQAFVFNNPNTIDIFDDKYLFVSCRGPNNIEDYTKPSPVDGKIYVLSLENLSLEKIIQAKNQPTGLDISPSDKYLCFSNFQNADIELYLLK